jgi:hypothetical protein
MYKSTNIESLGTEYTVLNQEGIVIKKVRIIPHTQILEAALGPYDVEKFSSITQYLDSSIALLKGFEEINPRAILWYATTDKEIVLDGIVEYAVTNGYDKIILEHLEELE